MIKNMKFKFEDEYFSTAFLILATVGWVSFTVSSGGNSVFISENASIAPIAMNPKKVAKDAQAAKKASKASKASAVAAAVQTTPAKAVELVTTESSALSDMAARDLSNLTNKINNKAGETVVVYDSSGPTEKLHVDAAFILLTDKRPRISAAKSKIVAPAIVAFAARKKVTAYIDSDSTAPESYIQAVEKYISSYNNLKVERRILTTAQKQLELTLEVQ